MAVLSLSSLFFLVLTAVTTSTAQRYDATWNSLDSRPNPDWYDDAKVGIFIHWGIFSVPSFRTEWFWMQLRGWNDPEVVQYMADNYPPRFTYPDFARELTAEFFSASEWANLLQASGARYVVLTSRHHEGYALWPSPYSWPWNSLEIGPNRDLVGELSSAIRNQTNLKFGLYSTLLEWFHPLYLRDKDNGFTTQEFVTTKVMPELYELVNKYKPDIVWSDGEWEAPDTYWNATNFISWLYNDSPVKDIVVTNDRWGKDVPCHHGGIYTCNDRYNPGYLVVHKWENALTLDWKSWGFRRNANIEDFMTIEYLIEQVVTTVSCNGNILVNIGPSAEGKISPMYQQRLHQLGSWLSVNGEAIYGSRPWTYQNDTATSRIWYTQNNKTSPAVVYAILLFWPDTNTLDLGAPIPSPTTEVTLLGYQGQPFAWTAQPSRGMTITIPNINYNQMPGQWAWTLKLTNLDDFQ